MSNDDLVQRALRLLSQPTPTAVPVTSSIAEPVEIQPGAPHARPIYWETGDGRILGPAVPECLAQVGAEFWIVTTFDAQLRWIRADRLRSRRAFEQQPKVCQHSSAPFSYAGKVKE